jgi:hypothetical protein
MRVAQMVRRRLSHSTCSCRGSTLGKEAHLSASSRMTILWRPGGSVTFFCANILILFRTTSMPLRTCGSNSVSV